MDTSVLIACLLSFVGGAAFMAVGLWFRDQTADAERWGRQLGRDETTRPGWPVAAVGSASPSQDPSVWHGLEDVRVRVRPIYDYDKEKKA